MRSKPGKNRAFQAVWIHAVVAGVLLALLPGCQLSNKERLRAAAKVVSLGVSPVAKVERVSRPRKISYLEQLVVRPPAPSQRTQQLLRRYDLADRFDSDPEFVIRYLQDVCRATPRMEDVHALAEIALSRGQWLERTRKEKQAQQLYATAMVSAYQFLFDEKLQLNRNAYDPHFRDICDIYNEALENILRHICEEEGLRNGSVYTIEGIAESGMKFNLEVELRGRWKSHEFEQIELTNDFEMEGINNHYHTFGLGVPLIAVHEAGHTESVSDEYYPAGMALPMTAFCEVACDADGSFDNSKTRTVRLGIYDPLDQTFVRVGNRMVPLESDITTPLAYMLSDPLLNTGVLETISMFNANAIGELYGMLFQEPYDPEKIPVVFVHGLWSSPTTWLEMFNDLRSVPELRANYQFWFYAYPTGQPFWISAQQMREDLAELRRKMDPNGTSESWKKMVLVGHSMGGLVSRLQTIDSEDDFWQLVSKSEFESWSGDPEKLGRLKQTFFFEANPNIKRVITLAAPHEGSKVANNLTRWASQKFFTLPDVITSDFRKLANENSERVVDRALLTMNTSVDSLSPESKFIKVMNVLGPNRKVHYHNVVGNVPKNALLKKVGFAEDGDGIVSLSSSRAFTAESEIEVEAEHQQVHQHPQSILEVRRILEEHLDEFGGRPRRR